MTEAEFQTIIEDSTKVVLGDIRWSEDEDHSPALEFQVEVESTAGYPIFVKGTWNREARAISFAIIHRTAGRIYGLDLGKDHHNPSCQYTGEKHKHRWTDRFRDKDAYVPGDITATVDNPIEVWQQFCMEAAIKHEGRMHAPPTKQEALL